MVNFPWIPDLTVSNAEDQPNDEPGPKEQADNEMKQMVDSPSLNDHRGGVMVMMAVMMRRRHHNRLARLRSVLSLVLLRGRCIVNVRLRLRLVLHLWRWLVVTWSTTEARLNTVWIVGRRLFSILGIHFCRRGEEKRLDDFKWISSFSRTRKRQTQQEMRHRQQ